MTSFAVAVAVAVAAEGRRQPVRGRPQPCRSKLLRRQIPQTAVRTFLVILLPPGCDLAPRFEQVLEPTHLQALLAQPPMKAFHACVLDRFPRLNVHQLDAPLHAPGQKVPAGQFRSVVATDRQRRSALGHDLLQHPCHPPALKAGVHFQRQTLACARVHHAQHPDPAPALHRIVHEVQRPLLVRCRARRQRPSLPHAVFTPLPPDRQARLPVHPIHSFVVHALSAAPSQEHLESPVAVARLLPRQLLQLLPQSCTASSDTDSC